MNLPDHLGGHCNKTHLDVGALDYLIENYQVTSMLDVGCGPGGMVELAKGKGLKAKGIDGDFTLQFSSPENFIVHDFAQGPVDIAENFDLVWCCAFNEHVEEKYIPNFMSAVNKGKIVIMTYYELPGHHHVNCQPASYWIDVMKENGFDYDESLTLNVREASTMNKVGEGKYTPKAWIHYYGLAFKRGEK